MRFYDFTKGNIRTQLIRFSIPFFLTRSGVGLATPTGTLSAIIICTWFYLSNRWCESTIA